MRRRITTRSIVMPEETKTTTEETTNTTTSNEEVVPPVVEPVVPTILEMRICTVLMIAKNRMIQGKIARELFEEIKELADDETFIDRFFPGNRWFQDAEGYAESVAAVREAAAVAETVVEAKDNSDIELTDLGKVLMKLIVEEGILNDDPSSKPHERMMKRMQKAFEKHTLGEMFFRGYIPGKSDGLSITEKFNSSKDLAKIGGFGKKEFQEIWGDVQMKDFVGKK